MKAELVNSSPVRWWSLVGLVLVPILVAGGFLVAGVNSDSRLKQVQAAVVNLDDPVTIDGNYTPLGRQLTANLVDSDREQNLAWVLDSEANAKAGIATGSYAAMVVIPKNFSAAATSFSKDDAGEAERATIELTTSPVAGVADATLGKVVALAATNALNQTLTSTYLENIYVGFNDMGKQFQTMADGATDLAKGTDKLVTGIGSAADGSAQLATGTKKLADGLDEMSSKTKSMPSDTRKLSDGVGDYVKGANTLAQSTIDSLPAQVKMVGSVKLLSDGASGLSSGLKTYQSTLNSNAKKAKDGADGLAQILKAVQSDPATYIPLAISTIKTACDMTTTTARLGVDGPVCVASLTATSEALSGAAAGLDMKDSTTKQSILSGASALAGGMETFYKGLAASVPSQQEADATIKQLKTMISGGKKLASGTDQLADGMPALTKGISQSADGAAQLADGTTSLSKGLAEAKTGGSKLADGMWQMADGISKGLDKLPSYDKSDRTNLAKVVSEPVSTSDLQGIANPNVGWVSLLLVVALWLGALATWAVVKAIGRGLLSSSDPTWMMIGRALLPGLIVVGAQAVVLALLAQLGLHLSGPKWLAVSGVLLVSAIAFALLNHALVALWGGIGRLISIVFAVITTAATLSPSAPGVLTVLRPFSPLTPALDAIRAIATESSLATTSTLLVVGWLIVGLAMSSVAIARRRTTTLAQVVAETT